MRAGKIFPCRYCGRQTFFPCALSVGMLRAFRGDTGRNGAPEPFFARSQHATPTAGAPNFATALAKIDRGQLHAGSTPPIFLPMQQTSKNDFLPRWVLFILFTSLLEAIGLAIHFKAMLVDPELASMQAEIVQVQQAAAILPASPACGDCRVAGKPAVPIRKAGNRDRPSRHAHVRQTHPVHVTHRG